jgi:L-lactate dehydrogenase (cytochrome)
MRTNFDPSIGWADLDFIRAHWSGPLVIKGILDPGDARSAVSAGADGIIVSNHGGRQLDGVHSTTRALPAIADAVGAETTVLADGGVHSGLDVVRLLALGAKGVLLGRAWAYALAGAGEAGVAHVLSLLAAEMQVAMTLTGCRNVEQIDRSALSAWPIADRAPTKDHLEMRENAHGPGTGRDLAQQAKSTTGPIKNRSEQR